MTSAQKSPAADSGRRLMVVHAHPDDEAIMTGGIIARYLAEGVEVTVVTCTLGEEGEVIGDRWAGLAADGGADQLGGYRVLELTRALDALRAPGTTLTPTFLGGAGRWRDSGMAGSPAAEHPRAFTNAPPDAPVTALADLICALRPQVLVGYDPAGTYGHPDHVQVHRICGAAVAEARERGWSVRKHYWSVTEESALRRGLEGGVESRLPDGWRMPLADELPRYPDAEITTAVDVREVYQRKVDALAAHATQVTVAPSRTEYALSNNIIQPISGDEHFILVEGTHEAPAPGERETDLFGPSTEDV